MYYKGSVGLLSHQYNVLAKFKFVYKNDVEDVMKGSQHAIVNTNDNLGLNR